MKRLASLSARWWWAVLGTWAVLVVGLHFAAPPFSKVAIYDFSQFLGHSSHSVRGGALLSSGWKDGSFDRSLAIVVSRDHGKLGAADETYARGLTTWLRSPAKPPHIGEVTTHLDDPRLADTLASRDGSRSTRVARLLAQNLSENDMVQEIFLATLGRTPTDEEKAALLKNRATRASREEWLSDVQWALLNKLDFLFNY